MHDKDGCWRMAKAAAFQEKGTARALPDTLAVVLVAEDSPIADYRRSTRLKRDKGVSTEARPLNINGPASMLLA